MKENKQTNQTNKITKQNQTNKNQSYQVQITSIGPQVKYPCSKPNMDYHIIDSKKHTTTLTKLLL